MPWSGGVYTRGYPSWSNDAANNLPISATKFDTEDNDFAGGLNNTLTRDGLTSPSATLTWGQTSTPVANFTRASDGTVFEISRTGGSHNPQLQLQTQDATGVTLNTTFGSISLAVAATAVLAVAAAGITASQPLTLQNGNAGAPQLVFANQATDGFYSVAAGELGIAIAGVQAGDIRAGTISAVAPAASAASIVAAGNGVTIANGFTLQYTAAGGGAFRIANAAVMTVSTAGAWAIPAPGAGNTALSVTAIANSNALFLIGSSTSGQSFGLRMTAGSTSADWALRITNQASSADYFEVAGDGQTYVTQPAAATTPSNFTGTGWQVGYLDVPPNAQNSSYQLVITDRGKFLFFTGSPPITYTIPANASVAFPQGTVIGIAHYGSAGNITIAITTDTLRWAPTGGTGSRTLAQFGYATLLKVAPTTWQITGVGLS